MELVVVIFLKPQPEGLVELLQGYPFLDAGEEAIPDGPKRPLM
jgi:hypothetical protein